MAVGQLIYVKLAAVVVMTGLNDFLITRADFLPGRRRPERFSG